MPKNKNWPRWIKASLVKHFYQELVTTGGFHLHVEGSTRDTDDKTDWFELRIDGPDIFEHSKNEFCLNVTVDIMVVTERTTQNIYSDCDYVGEACATFQHSIKVFETGKTTDSGDWIGTLTFTPVGDRELIITPLGQPREGVNTYRTSIEGKYRLYLAGD